MGAADVVAVVDALEAADLPYRLDGGWGVDALAGAQTREHDDLDLVVVRADLDRIVAALATLGFRRVPDVEPGLPARLVLRAPGGRQVDLHPLVFDARSDGLQELGDGEWGRYRAEGLGAMGTVADRSVPCISPALQLEHHEGYEQDERDRHDIELLNSLVDRS